MTKTAAIITAVYDGYDTLKPACPQDGVDVDWVFVTDDRAMISVGESLGWRVIVEPRPGVHPNRAAKRPKFLPWEYTDAPMSVWVDGSFRIVSPEFIYSALLLADPIAQFKHPWRDCLYAEARECMAIRKYDPAVLSAQIHEYSVQGHPENWGLWATGVIARTHTYAVKQLGKQWLEEINRWSYQDQVSQTHVLRKVGLRPMDFPGTHLANGWVQYEGSERH